MAGGSAAANVTAAVGAIHDVASVDLVVPFLCLALACGAVLQQINARMASTETCTGLNHIRIPYSVWLGVAGIALGALDHAFGLASVKETLSIHPHVILFLLLPPLIFESAANLDVHAVSKVIHQALLMALPGVFIATGLTAAMLKVMFWSYNWTWSGALLAGCILSATDPVAVVAVLKDLKAPPKLASLIEGESLLNDGTAFVLFLIFQDLAGGAKLDMGAAVGDFFQLAVGGLGWGTLCALVVLFWLWLSIWAPRAEVMVVIMATFATYFFGEHSLHVSGVLATVAFGVMYAYVVKFFMSIKAQEMSHELWEEVGYLANTIIFVIAGILIYNEAFERENPLGFQWQSWLYLLFTYIVIHVVRAVVLLIMFPLMAQGEYAVSVNEALVVWLGGLRGAVGLALALLVQSTPGIDKELRSQISFQVAGIVLLTLLINGMLAPIVFPRLLPKRDLYVSPELVINALKHADEETNHHLHHLRGSEPSLVHVNWGLVRHLIPRLAPPNDRSARAREAKIVKSGQRDAVTLLEGDLNVLMRLIHVRRAMEQYKPSDAGSGRASRRDPSTRGSHTHGAHTLDISDLIYPKTGVDEEHDTQDATQADFEMRSRTPTRRRYRPAEATWGDGRALPAVLSAPASQGGSSTGGGGGGGVQRPVSDSELGITMTAPPDLSGNSGKGHSGNGDSSSKSGAGGAGGATTASAAAAGGGGGAGAGAGAAAAGTGGGSGSSNSLRPPVSRGANLRVATNQGSVSSVPDLLSPDRNEFEVGADSSWRGLGSSSVMLDGSLTTVSETDTPRKTGGRSASWRAGVSATEAAEAETGSGRPDDEASDDDEEAERQRAARAGDDESGSVGSDISDWGVTDMRAAVSESGSSSSGRGEGIDTRGDMSPRGNASPAALASQGVAVVDGGEVDGAVASMRRGSTGELSEDEGGVDNDDEEADEEAEDAILGELDAMDDIVMGNRTPQQTTAGEEAAGSGGGAGAGAGAGAGSGSGLSETRSAKAALEHSTHTRRSSRASNGSSAGGVRSSLLRSTMSQDRPGAHTNVADQRNREEINRYVRLINQPGKDRKQVVASRMDAISADIGHGIESGDILDLMSTLADDKRQRLKQFHERHSAFYMAIIARMSHALKELNEEAMPGTVLAILKEALQEANDVNRFIYVRHKFLAQRRCCTGCCRRAKSGAQTDHGERQGRLMLPLFDALHVMESFADEDEECKWCTKRHATEAGIDVSPDHMYRATSDGSTLSANRSSSSHGRRRHSVTRERLSKRHHGKNCCDVLLCKSACRVHAPGCLKCGCGPCRPAVFYVKKNANRVEGVLGFVRMLESVKRDANLMSHISIKVPNLLVEIDAVLTRSYHLLDKLHKRCPAVTVIASSLAATKHILEEQSKMMSESMRNSGVLTAESVDSILRNLANRQYQLRDYLLADYKLYVRYAEDNSEPHL